MCSDNLASWVQAVTSVALVVVTIIYAYFTAKLATSSDSAAATAKEMAQFAERAAETAKETAQFAERAAETAKETALYVERAADASLAKIGVSIDVTMGYARDKYNNEITNSLGVFVTWDGPYVYLRGVFLEELYEWNNDLGGESFSLGLIGDPVQLHYLGSSDSPLPKWLDRGRRLSLMTPVDSVPSPIRMGGVVLLEYSFTPDGEVYRVRGRYRHG